jgi:hypothetical protein
MWKHAVPVGQFPRTTFRHQLSLPVGLVGPGGKYASVAALVEAEIRPAMREKGLLLEPSSWTSQQQPATSSQQWLPPPPEVLQRLAKLGEVVRKEVAGPSGLVGGLSLQRMLERSRRSKGHKTAHDVLWQLMMRVTGLTVQQLKAHGMRLVGQDGKFWELLVEALVATAAVYGLDLEQVLRELHRQLPKELYMPAFQRWVDAAWECSKVLLDKSIASRKQGTPGRRRTKHGECAYRPLLLELVNEKRPGSAR